MLTARSEDKLTQTANEPTTTYGLKVHVFPADITSAGAPEQPIERIKARGLPVDLLINNAGFGKWSHFLSEDLDTYAQMLRLNIDALVTLTQERARQKRRRPKSAHSGPFSPVFWPHSRAMGLQTRQKLASLEALFDLDAFCRARSWLCIPDLLARKRGGVINVASTAAFQPLPYQAVYGASKTFVLNFTEALAGEYRNSGVRFLALCPGTTATHFMATANADTTGMPFATPQAVVQTGLAAFAKGRNPVVHGRMNALTALVPRWVTRAATVKTVVGMFEKKDGPKTCATGATGATVHQGPGTGGAAAPHAQKPTAIGAEPGSFQACFGW